MRSRAVLVSVGAVLVLLLAGCGGGGKITKSSSPADTESSADGSGTEDPGTDSGDPGTELTIPGTDETLPDFSDIPGAEGLEECTELGLLYANMSLAGLGDAGDAAEAEKAADELAKLLPDDLTDDLEIVRSAFAKVGEDIFAAGEAMSAPEFEAANKNLSDHITKVCEAVGG